MSLWGSTNDFVTVLAAAAESCDSLCSFPADVASSRCDVSSAIGAMSDIGVAGHSSEVNETLDPINIVDSTKMPWTRLFKNERND